MTRCSRARGSATRGSSTCPCARRRTAPAGRHGAPLRVRVVDRSQLELTQQGFAKLNSARDYVARDVAEDLVGLLGSDAGVRPGDVAVLVRYNHHALRIRDALDAAGIPAVINGAGSVFATPAAREWLRLLEALERPASPRAGAGGDDDVVPGLVRRAGRVGERGRVGGGPPAPARVGRGAAPARAGVADRDDHARRAPARPSAARGGRRAPADGPAPRRPVAARRGGGRAARHGSAGRVAAPADRGGRAGGRRGAQPAPGVRRRGRPGPHGPPQQGARVPGRLRPVPVGADVGRREADPDRLSRPRPRIPAHDRRRPRGAGLQAPQGPARLRAARGGPPARLRRA